MLTGTVVPLVTPLTPTGRVSADGVRRLVDSVRDGVVALLPALSSGEGWRLSRDQWTEVVGWAEEFSGDLPVLAGVTLPTTAEVVQRCRLAADLGVDAVVITAPFDPEATQETIFRHYATVREAVALPIMVYNENVLSGNDADAPTLRRICALPDVVGVKESSGSTALTRELVAALPDVPVFQGWEHLLTSVAGVAGLIGPLSNLEPDLCTAALVDPTPDRQSEVDAACARHGLLRDDWYREVKRELCRRGVLDTALTVEELS
ncbi:dihydrodipicolinate synthase family protein [Lentzea sp. NEAU-D13]|uniref:Dihydrodipicolinate synthase family protein n=1 Tax=Lentzea alba TaxID=2714351 RepID=A0A7C9VYV5_9PSEU|nr:dihydrodipicolinate synthase family protein [Lentzea alba]NGY62438.1 dihydrodipicolinate synthase family protein [Lentzea alba]